MRPDPNWESIPLPGHLRDHHDAKRFFAKLRLGALGCWIWTANTSTEGYGYFSTGVHTNRKCHLAHRWAYQILGHTIPDGLHLDHLCRNRNCVNPDHLEPVTCAENIRRGIGPCAINARKTHCKYGHPLSGDNLRITEGYKRKCRTCLRRWDAEHYARSKTRRDQQR